MTKTFRHIKPAKPFFPNSHDCLFIYLFLVLFCLFCLFLLLERSCRSSGERSRHPRGLSATHEWFIFQLLCKRVRVAAEDTRRRKCLRYDVGVGESGGVYGEAQAAAKAP